jgi:hypothetical protein
MTIAHYYIHSCSHKSRDSRDNAIIVREDVCTTDEDGTEHWEPALRIIRDPERPFYITLPQYRTHDFKKEFEEKSKLEEFRCKDSELRERLALALDLPPWKSKYMSIKELCESPYVYGADIDTETLVKQAYLKRQPEGKSAKITVGALDIETEVVGNKRINVVTFIHERDIYTVALKEFCKIYSNSDDILELDTNVRPRQATRDECLQVIDRVIGTEIKKNNFNLHFELADTELDLLLQIFKHIHECKTDVIGIWNIQFDIPKILKELEVLGVNPTSVFCPKEVPPELRVCKFVEDNNPHAEHIVDKWHWFNCTSYSQYIDSMCLYGRLRKVNGRDIKYSLDYISNKELGQGKLHLGEITNHRYSQQYDFLRYIAYNINDVLIMQLMEFKNHDIETLLGLSDCSLLKNFSKQTIIVRDGDYVYAQENGHVPSSASLNMFTVWDTVMPKVGGTVLPPEKAVGTRIAALKGMECKTQVSIMNDDLDETSMYPTATRVLNISKETCYGTVLGVNGFDTGYVELLGMASISPSAYCMQACETFFGLPGYEELEKEFNLEEK